MNIIPDPSMCRTLRLNHNVLGGFLSIKPAMNQLILLLTKADRTNKIEVEIK